MPERIKVELEFIPIEERLPDDIKWAYILVEGVGTMFIYPAYRVKGVWMWKHTSKPVEEVCPDSPPYIAMKVTHWAEIPEIEK